MLRSSLLTALLALAIAAPASADATFTCVLPAGAGGEAMEVTLAAEAGGCPGPGEAVPRKWIVGSPRVIGAAQEVAGVSASRPPVAPGRVVHAQPLGDARADTVPVRAEVPAAAVAAIEQARSVVAVGPAAQLAATARAGAEALHAGAADDDLSGFGLPAVLALLAAVALSGLLAARRGVPNAA